MKIISGTINTLKTLHFFIKTACREDLRNPFKDLSSERDKSLYLFANGPSLNKELLKIELEPDNYVENDYVVVNDFVNDSHFELIKPKFCVMSDPLFFMDTIYSERGHRAMESLSKKVAWPMLLFIPRRYMGSSYLEPIHTNPNISVITFHTMVYDGIEKFRNSIYRRGLGNGEFGTVALNAIYCGIMLGYKKIYCYGIDHTFFDNLIVNDKNELCHKSSYFYNNDGVLKPMLNHYSGINARPYRVSEYLYEKAYLFRGHEIMSKFAESMNVMIYNATENSMVDAYQRFK